jgi:Uma2 family endonuclease
MQTPAPPASPSEDGTAPYESALPLGRRFTVDEYYRLAEVGIIGPRERVELIAGQIIPMSPIGIRHGKCVDRLTMLLAVAAHHVGIVRVQNPLRISETYEPEPDLALVRRSFVDARA